MYIQKNQTAVNFFKNVNKHLSFFSKYKQTTDDFIPKCNVDTGHGPFPKKI